MVFGQLFNKFAPQTVSATATSDQVEGGGDGGGGGVGGFLGSAFQKLVELLRQQGKLPVPQAAATAAPAATASTIPPWTLSNLALDPFLNMPGGRERWGGIMNPVFQTLQRENYEALMAKRRAQIAAQNQAVAIPPEEPVNVGDPDFSAMNQYLAQYEAPQLEAHRGGFVHRHFLPGERILR